MAARTIDYLLIGGGLASANCARWLRESGADGSVMVVGREPDPPYNRPNCSKGYLRGEEERAEAFFRPDRWWGEHDIELLKRTSVTALDLAARTATLSDKQEIEFDKALLATGANVRRLDVPGCELEHVYYLRTLGNADSIRAGVADGHEVVVIGGSYIGCEVSASLTAIGKRCTIVMQESATMERGFGAHVGRFIQSQLEGVGVTVHGQDELARLEGADGRVHRVVTRNGLELAADAVVIGAGVTPEIGLAKRAGLATGERGGVACSDRLQTVASGVYAAGDICEYDSPLHGRPMRIEHWDVAFNQGKTAALNMLGADTPHETVPYFFSVLAGVGELEYVGPAMQWDEELLRGSFEQRSFTNWYLEDGRLVAALTWGRPDDLDVARRLLVAKPVLDERQRAALVSLEADLEEVAS